MLAALWPISSSRSLEAIPRCKNSRRVVVQHLPGLVVHRRTAQRRPAAPQAVAEVVQPVPQPTRSAAEVEGPERTDHRPARSD